MLLNFTVGNFLSFKNKVTLSMEVDSSISKNEQVNNHTEGGNLKILKSIAVYGANASGKSNLIEALRFTKKTIVESAKYDSTESISTVPFMLDKTSKTQPIFFEIRFLIEDVIFRYGFEIEQNRISSEWLFRKGMHGRESTLFTREYQDFDIREKFSEGKDLVKKHKVKDNSLLISVSDQFNGQVSSKIISWFKEKLQVITGLNDSSYLPYTKEKLQNENWRKKILKFLSKFSLGFDDITTIKLKKELEKPRFTGIISENIGSYYDSQEYTEIITLHKVSNGDDEKNDFTAFPYDFESEGTQKLIALSAPLVDTFESGITMVVDEFDTRMHPLITKKIIELFHDPQINKNNSQLIFATHDTNLLTNKLFRRDQIWFTEKDEEQSTDLYSLVDIEVGEDKKKVRNDASYEKDYILGKYGAIPYIGNLNNLDFEYE